MELCGKCVGDVMEMQWRYDGDVMERRGNGGAASGRIVIKL